MSSRCRINHAVILEDPFDDPPDLPVPDRSPEPTRDQLDVRTSAPGSAAPPPPPRGAHVKKLFVCRAAASERTR